MQTRRTMRRRFGRRRPGGAPRRLAAGGGQGTPGGRRRRDARRRPTESAPGQAERPNRSGDTHRAPWLRVKGESDFEHPGTTGGGPLPRPPRARRRARHGPPRGQGRLPAARQEDRRARGSGSVEREAPGGPGGALLEGGRGARSSGCPTGSAGSGGSSGSPGIPRADAREAAREPLPARARHRPPHRRGVLVRPVSDGDRHLRVHDDAHRGADRLEDLGWPLPGLPGRGGLLRPQLRRGAEGLPAANRSPRWRGAPRGARRGARLREGDGDRGVVGPLRHGAVLLPPREAPPRREALRGATRQLQLVRCRGGLPGAQPPRARGLEDGDAREPRPVP